MKGIFVVWTSCLKSSITICSFRAGLLCCCSWKVNHKKHKPLGVWFVPNSLLPHVQFSSNLWNLRVFLLTGCSSVLSQVQKYELLLQVLVITALQRWIILMNKVKMNNADIPLQIKLDMLHCFSSTVNMFFRKVKDFTVLVHWHLNLFFNVFERCLLCSPSTVKKLTSWEN